MITALIDNGSLAPAAHRTLRAVAAALSAATGQPVEPVSWKHSDRIQAERLDGTPAAVLSSWIRTRHEQGVREFLFVPFFISEQGAIGSALRGDIERLRQELGDFRYEFAPGLASHGDTLVQIVASRIREVLTRERLEAPPVIVVDHGGPSPASAQLRNRVAHALRGTLGTAVGPLIAASMEGEDYAHNRPLFADVLGTPGFDHGDVVVAPLFLAPGRHAGPHGDLAQIATAAEDRLAAPDLRCHFADLIGTHPDVIPALAAGVAQTITTFHVLA